MSDYPTYTLRGVTPGYVVVYKNNERIGYIDRHDDVFMAFTAAREPLDFRDTEGGALDLVIASASGGGAEGTVSDG